MFWFPGISQTLVETSRDCSSNMISFFPPLCLPKVVQIIIISRAAVLLKTPLVSSMTHPITHRSWEVMATSVDETEQNVAALIVRL